MTRVRVSDAVARQLRQAKSIVELTDETGAIVGRFIPHEPPPHEPYISEEELQRREREPGYSLKEIWADLEKRK